MKKMGKYNSFEMIQNYDIAIIKKLSYVPLSEVPTVRLFSKMITKRIDLTLRLSLLQN